ncbi:MAG: AzlD domain-containing protein [Acidimicrobiales bacterium]
MNRIWTAIVLAGIGTYAMRASFLAFAHRLADVPPAIQRLLRQIPPAALASIVLPALLRPEGSLDVTQPRLVAGVAAALVAWRTRNVALTLVVGMAVVMAIEAL